LWPGVVGEDVHPLRNGRRSGESLAVQERHDAVTLAVQDEQRGLQLPDLRLG